MSAIAGIINLENNSPVSSGTLISMLEAMRPVTNCDIETYPILEHRAVIGRLAYGSDEDCKTRQDKRGTSCQVFFVGELYNDKVSLYDSSANYLLDRYLRLRVESFADGLNGSFSAAIADSKNGSVTLITDHTAFCPLFTAIDGGKLYFASEVKGIMAVEQLRREPETSAVISLAARGFFVRGRTLMEGVRKMDYATVCHIQDGKVRSWPYWRYIVEPSADKGYKQHLDELTILLRQAVKRRTCTGKLAIMLSGGYDSRGILACMDNDCQIHAVTFTPQDAKERSRFGDCSIAEKVAENFGIAFSVIKYDCYDFISALQESIFSSDGAAGFVYENIWENIRQTTGAEFLLMGDQSMLWREGQISSLADALQASNLFSLSQLTLLQKYIRQDRLQEFIRMSESDLQAIITDYKAQRAHRNYPMLYLHHRMMHFMLPKRQITQRHGLFVRNPWLDLDLLDYVRCLPICYRRNKVLFRKALSNINPTLLNLPFAKRGESISYHPYLAAIERQNQGVTKLIFSENPFLEKFFDIPAVHGLINQLLSGSAETEPPQNRFDPFMFFPRALSLQMKGFIKRFIIKRPILSGSNLLLRIAIVAEALRHLSSFAHKR